MPRRPARSREHGGKGDVLVFRQGLEILRFIHAQPRQPAEIAAQFECSRRTVERILRTAEAFGLDIQVERRGRGAWYCLGGAGLPLRAAPADAPTGRKGAERAPPDRRRAPAH